MRFRSVAPRYTHIWHWLVASLPIIPVTNIAYSGTLSEIAKEPRLTAIKRLCI